MKKNIGITVKQPEKKCEDKHCPFHNQMPVRGRSFTGTVKKVNLHKTAVIEWQRTHFIPKFERYEKRFSRLIVHKPDCVNVQAGDVVTVMETRPISKTKNFVIVEVNQ